MDKDFENREAEYQLYKFGGEMAIENKKIKQKLKEMDDKIFEWMSKCFKLERQLEELKKGGEITCGNQ